MTKDYYKILEVSKDATQDEIKKAYRRLAHKYHPDKENGDEEKFKKINEAYQVLKDTEKRKKYDQFGTSFEQMGGWQSTAGVTWEDIMQGFRQQSSSSGFNFNFGGNSQGFTFDLGDIFSEFFGSNQRQGFSRSSSGRSARGKDIQVSLEIDFKEAVFGTEKEIELERFDKCSRCNGNRAEPGTKIVQCKQCGGSGKIVQTRKTILGTIRSENVCPKCYGEGKLPKQNCKKCNGEGLERVSKKIKVKVPAGISNGETIRLSGEGEVSEDLRHYGDLYVKISVDSHYKFKRDGQDLYSTEPISFTQAVLGDKIRVDTLEGKVDLKIPSGTASGTVFKLRRKGVPNLHGFGRGDLYVKVKIVVPDKISWRSKKILKELQKEGI